MPQKKKSQNKKTKVIKESGNPITIQEPEELDFDKEGNHIVVETKSPLTEEEQNENPLNRMKKLPDGFKTADQVTEIDDLKFENGRLREMLVAWVETVQHNGKTYQIEVDALNHKVSLHGGQ